MENPRIEQASDLTLVSARLMLIFSVQSIMCLIHVLLERDLKIMTLAKNGNATASKFAEKAEITDSWDYLFEAFHNRLQNLLQVWRQQHLDVNNHLICYSGGIFEKWHEKVGIWFTTRHRG